jgi:hypothetical protein
MATERKSTKRKSKPPLWRYRVEEAAKADPRLTGLTLLVLLLHLHYGDWETGERCQPGDRIERESGLSRRTVWGERRKLLEMGWLVVERRSRAYVYRYGIPGEEWPETAADRQAAKEQAEREQRIRVADAEIRAKLERKAAEEWEAVRAVQSAREATIANGWGVLRNHTPTMRNRMRIENPQRAALGALARALGVEAIDKEHDVPADFLQMCSRIDSGDFTLGYRGDLLTVLCGGEEVTP